MKSFISMGISEWLAETLKNIGISYPNSIQAQAIPKIMEGRDLMVRSQTGTGKTFAFAVPILEKVDPRNPSLQALILTPTRELALQITDEFKKLTAGKEGPGILAVYGGQDAKAQMKELKKGIQIVIGTPGRLLDHIRQQTIDFSYVNKLVLDEADQMLQIGFLEEVETIIKQTPKTRQTLLFSATMPEKIRELGKSHMRGPEYIQAEKKQAPSANVEQIAIRTTDRAKQNDLIESLRLYEPFLGVIFCRTKRRVHKLNEILQANFFSCDELHGDLSQAKREEVMINFRQARIQFLIATDVAARGLDVDGVTHVFNYDLPHDSESYIHRIGRTGRAGREGMAVTFYSAKDEKLLKMIETDLNIRIERKNGRLKHKEMAIQPAKRKNTKENPSRSGEIKGKYTRNHEGMRDRTQDREMQDQRANGTQKHLPGIRSAGAPTIENPSSKRPVTKTKGKRHPGLKDNREAFVQKGSWGDARSPKHRTGRLAKDKKHTDSLSSGSNKRISSNSRKS